MTELFFELPGFYFLPRRAQSHYKGHDGIAFLQSDRSYGAFFQVFNLSSLLLSLDQNKAPYERGFRGVSKPHRSEIIPYNPALKDLARQLRNNSTKSEIILVKELKGKFEGKYDFHWQKPLNNFIADFFCHELKLFIELDGITHNWEETQQKDFQKEHRLNELGLNVLRFPDSDIFQHLEIMIDIIRMYAEGFEKGDLPELPFEDSPLNLFSRNAPIVD